MVKKILKFLGVFLVLFIGALVVLPIVYKDAILNKIKAVANEQLNATVDFNNDKVSLSLITSFPDFSFSIGDVSVTGKEAFEGKKLTHIGSFNFTVNIMDVIGGKYALKSIALKDADFFVKVLRNGKANYDILKSSEETSTTEETASSDAAADFSFSLKQYSFENINLVYDDEPGNMFVSVQNFTHSGKGDLTATEYDIYTTTTIDAVTVAMDGVRYLKKAKIAVDFNAHIKNEETIRIKLLENSFGLNALKLNAEGEIALPPNGTYAMDLKFNAPKATFGSILSLIPSAYTADFDQVKTDGIFAFNGFAKGTYDGEKEKYPTFGLDFSVEKGYFKYPDLPLPIEDIATRVAVKSPTSNLDGMSVNVSQFHLKLGKNPFDASLLLQTPMSDPDIDAKMNGTINLEELAQAFPMEDVDALSGIITTNLEVATKMSNIDAEAYDAVKMNGLLGIEAMRYEAKGLPTVLLNKVRMNFTPNAVNLETVDMKLGKSDIQANGTLDNLLTYFSRDKVMRGELNVYSSVLDLDDMMAAMETAPEPDVAVVDTTSAIAMVDTTSLSEEALFDQFEFAMNVDVKKIKYETYKIEALKTSGTFAPHHARLKNYSMLLNGVDMQADGYLDHIFDYLFDNQTLIGVLNFSSSNMDLDALMAGMTEETTEEIEAPTDSTATLNTEPIQIPGNIDFTLKSKFNKLTYAPHLLENVLTEVHIHDHKVDINELSANAWGGKLSMSGLFNTQNPYKPSYNFAYDVVKLDVQKVAKTVEMVAELLPISKKLYGFFDSEFTMNGVVDKDFNPDLNSVVAKGMIKTYDVVVKNSEALGKLSKQLKIKDLENIHLENTTNFFSVKDGRMYLEPTTYNFKDMDIIASGSHGLDQTLDYEAKMSVPRAMMAQSSVGAAANQALSSGLAALQGQASKLGININQGDYINVGVDVSGTMDDPKYKVKLLGTANKGGTAGAGGVGAALKAEAERLRKEAEAKAKAELERIRKEAEDKARAEAERLRKEATDRAKAETDRFKREAEAKAKAEAARLKKEADARAKGLADKLAKDARTKAVQDSIKNALKNKNPLKGIKNPFK